MEIEAKKFSCPCCGFLTLPEEADGTYNICPVCLWEDDYVQLNDPDFEGGANKPSLNQARENFKIHSVSDMKLAHLSRPPLDSEMY